MPEVFADTGYWIALLNERDSLHSKARELSARLVDSTIVTTEMVLTEFLNHATGCLGALPGPAGSELERRGLRKLHRHGNTPDPGSPGL